MSFDFSKYYDDEPGKQQEQGPEEQPQISEPPGIQKPPVPFDFSKYHDKKEPTVLEETGRHVVRTGARIAESVAGTGGNLVGFAKYLTKALPKLPEALESGVGGGSPIQKYGRKALEKLPSSDDLKKLSSEFTSGFTDPQSAQEEFGDEVAGLFGDLAVGAENPKTFYNLLNTIGKNVFKAAAAKGTGKVAELYGASPKAKAVTEIGTLFLMGQLGKRAPDAYVKEQYEQVKKKIPQQTMVNTTGLANDLGNIEQEFSKGLTTGTKTEVLKPLSELKAKASGGAMPAEELFQSYRDINEHMNAKNLFDTFSKSDRDLLKYRYGILKDELKKPILSLKSQYPEAIDQWLNANEAKSILMQSEGIKNFLKSHAKSLPGHLATGMAIKFFLGTSGMTAVGAGTTSYFAGRILKRMAKSPTLRQHYLNVIKESSKENWPAVLSNLNRMEKELKSSGLEEPKD